MKVGGARLGALVPGRAAAQGLSPAPVPGPARVPMPALALAFALALGPAPLAAQGDLQAEI
ncbi:MAG: hypothetical protein D6701_00740, partial [Gemmatimonadetes bacterium]